MLFLLKRIPRLTFYNCCLSSKIRKTLQELGRESKVRTDTQEMKPRGDCCVSATGNTPCHKLGPWAGTEAMGAVTSITPGSSALKETDSEEEEGLPLTLTPRQLGPIQSGLELNSAADSRSKGR